MSETIASDAKRMTAGEFNKAIEHSIRNDRYSQIAMNGQATWSVDPELDGCMTGSSPSSDFEPCGPSGDVIKLQQGNPSYDVYLVTLDGENGAWLFYVSHIGWDSRIQEIDL